LAGEREGGRVKGRGKGKGERGKVLNSGIAESEDEF